MQKPTWNIKKKQEDVTGSTSGNEGATSNQKVRTNNTRTFKSERRSGTRGS